MSLTPRMRVGERLAVYGLLRPSESGLDRLRVRSKIVDRGGCRIPGTLIDLGGYPGLIAGAGEVRGDLLELRSLRAGDALDAFEDFKPADPEGSAYRRVRIRLVRPPVHAWVYLWNGPNDAGSVIAGGDWLKRGR